MDGQTVAGAHRFIVGERLLLADKAPPGACGVAVSGNRIEGLLGREAPVPTAQVDRYPGATILPGLIDAHVHACLAYGEDLLRPPDDELIAASIEVGKQTVSGMLAAGVTTARDLGARGSSAQIVRDSLVPGRGLRLRVAGRPITSPGGHFATFGRVVRGPKAAVRAVDELVDEDVDVIKLVLTGGTLTPGTDPSEAQFDLAEVRAMTERAAVHGRTVAAHAHGLAGIEVAVEAGVGTIEHCTWARSGATPGLPVVETVDKIARLGQVVVVAGPLPGSLLTEPGLPEDEYRKNADLQRMQQVWSNAATLREAGVEVALGTDSLFGQFSGWQDLALRAEAMVNLGGWSSLDVISLMTKGGAAALGLSRSVGRLGPGFQADILVVDGDPSSDISSLRRVLAVYTAGQLVRALPPRS
jgi:imidazolonepropionase-like amidohydrolase